MWCVGGETPPMCRADGAPVFLAADPAPGAADDAAARAQAAASKARTKAVLKRWQRELDKEAVISVPEPGGPPHGQEQQFVIRMLTGFADQEKETQQLLESLRDWCGNYGLVNPRVVMGLDGEDKEEVSARAPRFCGDRGAWGACARRGRVLEVGGRVGWGREWAERAWQEAGQASGYVGTPKPAVPAAWITPATR